MSGVSLSLVADSLSNPLTLVGFALFLLFGVQHTLLKSGIIPPIAKPHAPTILKLLFWLAVLLVIFGIGYALLKIAFSHIGRYFDNLSTRTPVLFAADTYKEEDESNKNSNGSIVGIKLTHEGTGHNRKLNCYLIREKAYFNLHAGGICHFGISL
jgi:hypothetical protein